jgi:hypothetical protein
VSAPTQSLVYDTVSTMKTIKKSGDWELREFAVTKDDEKIQMLNPSYRQLGRFVPAGTYLQLLREDIIVMSNTPDELKDFKYFLDECNMLYKRKGAKIDILIAGLGMGCVVDALLKSDCGAEITVVEKSQDVINITAPKYKDCKNVKIVEDDIFELDNKKLPSKHYDIAWFDIWDDICSSNIEEFKKLRRKYSRKAKLKRFWAEHMCKIALIESQSLMY